MRKFAEQFMGRLYSMHSKELKRFLEIETHSREKSKAFGMYKQDVK